MLVALINMLCLPAARVKVAVKRLKKKLGHLPQKAIDHLCGPEYVRVPHEAFVPTCVFGVTVLLDPCGDPRLCGHLAVYL